MMKNGFQLNTGSSIILDLIRGLTAQIVVFGHSISFFGIFIFMHPPNFPWVQNIAVLIFFILSGLLISYSTINKIKNKNDYSFKHFFIDRFSRIYSAFIPGILFVFVIDFLSRKIQNDYLFDKAFNVKTFIGNLFMLQDYPLYDNLGKVLIDLGFDNFLVNAIPVPFKAITSFGSARPFWTIAIEWWIYMFFGYFTIVTLKKRMTIINFGKLAFLSIIPLYNLVSGRGDGLTVYWGFGALVFLFLQNNILKNIKPSVKIISLLLVVGLASFRVLKTINAYEPIFAFLVAISILLLVDLFKSITFSRLLAKIIRISANYSFTLYLIHYSILNFIYTHFYQNYNPYLLLFIGFFSSNIISYAIGYFTEIKLTFAVKKKLYTRFLE